MNNRFPIILQAAVLILLLGLGITGCGSVSDGAGPANGSTEYVIRLGHSDTEDNLIHASLQHYADYVKEQTEGRVVIRLYPNEELGGNPSVADQYPELLSDHRAVLYRYGSRIPQPRSRNGRYAAGRSGSRICDWEKIE